MEEVSCSFPNLSLSEADKQAAPKAEATETPMSSHVGSDVEKAPNSSHADTEIEAPTSSVIKVVQCAKTNRDTAEGSKEEGAVGAIMAVIEKEGGNADATPEKAGATMIDKDVVVAWADMSHMPDLVLRKIFSFLPFREKRVRKSIELVCRRWLQVWRSSRPIVLNLVVRQILNEDFYRFGDYVRQTSGVKRIKLTDGCTWERDIGLAAAFVRFARTFPELDYLEVALSSPRRWEPFRHFLDQSGAELRNLRHLVIQFSYDGNPRMAELPECRSVGSNPIWPSLTSLKIRAGHSLALGSYISSQMGSLVPPIHSDIYKVCSGSSASLKKLVLYCNAIRSPFIEKLVALCPLLEDVTFQLSADPLFCSKAECDVADLRKLKLKKIRLYLSTKADSVLQQQLEEILTGQSRLQVLDIDVKFDGADIACGNRLAEIVCRGSPHSAEGVIDVGGSPILIRDGKYSVVKDREDYFFRLKKGFVREHFFFNTLYIV